MRLFKATFVVLCGLLLLLGCSVNEPSQKAEAQKRWSDARATILAGVAQDQYRAHDFVKCRETLDKAMAMSPNSARLHILAGKLEIEQGHLEAAELQLEMARTAAPSDPEPYYLSGVVYQRWQKPQTALDFYGQAAQRAPAELAYVLAEGEMLVIVDRRDDALALLQSKVGYFENSSSIRDAVAQLLVQKGKYDEATRMYRQASVLAEDDNGIRERLATAYYYNREYRQCAAVLARLTSAEPGSKRSDLLELQGECQLQINDPHGSARSFNAATDINPLSARAWLGMGRAVLQQGDANRAEIALRRGVGLDGSSAQAHLLLGYAQMRLENYSDALDSFKTAMKLEPADTTPICMLGYTLEKLGRTREAARYYQQALQVKPGDDMASELMAQIDLQSAN